jgi:hypothetical protein
MQIHLGDDPFKVWVRREPGYEPGCSVRFEAEHGQAVLSLRVPGREDSAPVSHYEEEHIDAEAMRQGRFVHVLPGGNRRSYALSRLTVEILQKLPENRYVQLEPLTEFGFRYLVFPRDLPVPESKAATAEAPAKAAAATPAAAKPAASQSNAVTARRPAPVAKTSDAPPRRSSSVGARPARQTPVAPELAHEALSQLSQAAAIQHLKMEMAKVEALHNRVDELERRIAASQERERDLLAVLQKWQAMDT